MEFHKLAGRLIIVGALWQIVLTVPVDQAGNEQLEREETPGRQFGGFLVEHPDFPGRPVFLQDPPDAGTIGQRPTSLLSEFGLDISNFPSFAAKPGADADADAEVYSDPAVETDEGGNSEPNRRREDKNKNTYQPQYRPQYRPQNRPHRPQSKPQQSAVQYGNRPQYHKPRPQYEKPQPLFEKPKPQYVHPESTESHGKQEYEAFMVKFPGYGHYIVLAEPGTVGAGHSSPFQLVHKPMGYVTLYPKTTKGVEVKVGDTEAPTTTTAAPLKRDAVRDQPLEAALYAGVSEKDDEAATAS